MTAGRSSADSWYFRAGREVREPGIHGRLARSPSFWITRVDLVRYYRRIRGHRVVSRIESVSHVWLLGRVRLVVDFDYEAIDGDVIAQQPS